MEYLEIFCLAVLLSLLRGLFGFFMIIDIIPQQLWVQKGVSHIPTTAALLVELGPWELMNFPSVVCG